MTATAKIEGLKSIFLGIDFHISSRISNEINEMFTQTQDYNIDLIEARNFLENCLREQRRELKKAKTLFKKNKITEDSLFLIECKIQDILSEIDEINYKLKY